MRLRLKLAAALAGLTIASAAAAQSCDADAIATATTGRPRTEANRIADFATQQANLPSSADILLIGDSHAAYLPLALMTRTFPGLIAYKFAVGGDRTEHLIWRIKHTPALGAVRPRVVLLSIGSNNIAGGVPPCAVLAGFDKAYGELRALWPRAEFVLIEPPARGPFQDQREDARSEYVAALRQRARDMPKLKFAALPDAVRACGAIARRIADGNGGTLPADYACPAMRPDNVHMSESSYDDLAGELRGMLR